MDKIWSWNKVEVGSDDKMKNQDVRNIIGIRLGGLRQIKPSKPSLKEKS
jgi:hypothetical protein